MKRALLLFLFSLVCLCGYGQLLKGTVSDAETGKPLFAVTIVNTVTQETAYTDEQGFFSIAAHNEDLMAVTYLGYKTIQLKARPGIDQRITLLPLSVRLQEFVVRDYTPFQKDSMAMTALYSTELNKKAIKPSFSSANGGGMSGLIGGPVQKISKSYKQNKKFKENFKRDMEQKYIDTRYTPVLVNALTSFAGDTLAIFMNTYPMDYGFARTATDLELKIWIRSNYKDYLHKQSLAAPRVQSH